jgi:adenosylcobinamide-GDP ribazoletransferase
MWNQLGIAVSFLTVFRLPFTSLEETDSKDLAGSFSFFPLVGLVPGVCCGALVVALHRWMPPLLLAVVITAALALLTRGLHLDGLADLADGAGGGYTPERRLAIMKDSSTGAFGALALALAVSFKVAAFHGLIAARSWSPFFLVPVLSRFAMVLAAYKAPYPRPQGGLGKPFLQSMSALQPLLAAVFALSLCALLNLRHAWIYLVLALLCVGVLRLLARRWLGGVTGDVLGALNEIAEIVLFSCAACLA